MTTTAEHPLWVTDAGWTAAGDLEPGMRVSTASGATVAVERVEILDRTATVHNIEVPGLHTYFVSDERVLAHNKAMRNLVPDPPPLGYSGKSSQYTRTEYHGLDRKISRGIATREVRDAVRGSRPIRQYDADLGIHKFQYEGRNGVTAILDEEGGLISVFRGR